MRDSRKILQVVAPLYNEAEGIEQFASTVLDALAAITPSFELILVDDGSTDESWKIVSELAKCNIRIQAIRLSRNFGKEAALRAGLERSDAAAVVVMDADLQHPPDLIAQMFSIWQSGNALVVEAVRREERRDTWLKTVGAAVAYESLRRMTGVALQGKSDFKLLDRAVVDHLCSLPEVNRFFRGLVAWYGFPTTEVQYELQQRLHGSTKWGFWKLAVLSIDMATCFTVVPLRFVTLLSILAIVISTLLGLQTVYQYLFNNAVEGFTTVIISVLFVGGLTGMALGIIGEYLGRIFEEVKRRPAYLVCESVCDGRNKGVLARTGGDAS